MTKKPTYEELEKKIQGLEHAEDALRESEKNYKTIVENIEDGYYEVDIAGNFTIHNDSMCKILGYSKDELTGLNNRCFTDEKNAKKVFKTFNRVYKTGQPYKAFDWELIKKDGSRCYVEISVAIRSDSKGQPISFQGIARDITERKQAEKALRESNSSLQSVFEAVPVGICFMKDRVYKRVNQNWCNSFGYPEKSVLGRTTEFLYEKKKEYERVGKELYEQIHEHGITLVHTSLKRSDGEFRDVDLIAKPLNSQKLADGTVVVVHDITERKKAEKEKIKAQKIAGEQEQQALVGQVAGRMAHDFNNILGIIMGNTELSLIDCKDEATKRTLELIFEQTIRGKNLTRNLVAFAKNQEPKQEFFRISEKVDLVLNLMKKDLEGIGLQKEESTEVPELLADPGMIEHALVNLIQNSIHALSMVEFPRIIVRTYSLDNKICFEIEDNGCGISKENLENIYEPSFTLKGNKDVTESYKSNIKGTGYGMANVKKYVEQHKGSISIESELCVGTTFTICLPIIKKELTTKEKVELKKEITQFDKHILLVEDETAISDVQYRILTSEPCNHKVDIAHNGQIAKDLFERNTYDFVSLDYVLSGGINGMDVYHHIRKINQTVPVLFISGNIEFLESIKELKQKDAYIDHLSKPCQNKDYVNGINGLLEKTLAEQ